MNASSLHRVRIVSLTPVALDTASFELVAADGSELPPFDAGSHIDVHVGEGLVRQYSLANDPAERGRYVIAVKRESGGRGGSVFMHDRLSVGDDVLVGGPRNNFPLQPETREARLVAGGIGITPIMSMIATLERNACPWQLDYFARSAEHAAFTETFPRFGGGNVRAHFSDRVVTDFSPIVGPWQEGRHLYCCGPGGLMDAVRAGARGWPSANVHFESFRAAPLDDTGNVPFTVELARSGVVLTVPADRSIMETLRDNGFDAPSSCEEGICGTCETRLLAGTPDHRDGLLTDAEIEANDRILICVSRARGGRLVLDL